MGGVGQVGWGGRRATKRRYLDLQVDGSRCHAGGNTTSVSCLSASRSKTASKMSRWLRSTHDNFV